jgi:hypothetical protein
MASSSQCPTKFLNVDLDLCGSGLEELLGYLGCSVLVMHQTAQDLALELSDSNNDSLDVTLAKWVELIQSLPEQGRAIWDRCDRRSMNIGIQSSGEPHAAVFAVSSTTVSRLAGIQAEIALTVYAPVE